jgi:transcriptional regulator with XRE-family HTH domain
VISGIDAKAAAFTASIRDQLQRARERRGWTVEELSEQTKWVSLRLLDRYERGETDLGVFEFRFACSALDLDVRDVLDEAQRMAESIIDESEERQP